MMLLPMKERVQSRREGTPLAATDPLTAGGRVERGGKAAQQIIRVTRLVDSEDEATEDADDDTPPHDVVTFVLVHDQGERPAENQADESPVEGVLCNRGHPAVRALGRSCRTPRAQRDQEKEK